MVQFSQYPESIKILQTGFLLWIQGGEGKGKLTLAEHIALGHLEIVPQDRPSIPSLWQLSP